MGYRSDVSLLVRTEDLENFKKNNFEQYKLAFLRAWITTRCSQQVKMVQQNITLTISQCVVRDCYTAK